MVVLDSMKLKVGVPLLARIVIRLVLKKAKAFRGPLGGQFRRGSVEAWGLGRVDEVLSILHSAQY